MLTFELLEHVTQNILITLAFLQCEHLKISKPMSNLELVRLNRIHFRFKLFMLPLNDKSKNYIV